MVEKCQACNGDGKATYTDGIVRGPCPVCCEHVWQEHDVYGEVCTKCEVHRDPANSHN
jgi:hypothetical protein